MFIKDLLVKTEIIPLTKPFKTALRIVEEIESNIMEIVLDEGNRCSCAYRRHYR